MMADACRIFVLCVTESDNWVSTLDFTHYVNEKIIPPATESAVDVKLPSEKARDASENLLSKPTAASASAPRSGFFTNTPVDLPKHSEDSRYKRSKPAKQTSAAATMESEDISEPAQPEISLDSFRTAKEQLVCELNLVLSLETYLFQCSNCALFSDD